MLALVLDTATTRCVVGVAELGPSGDASILAARAVEAPNRHGEVLAQLITETLASAGVTFGALGCLGAGIGPGPFTGLRVGVVTAAALADSLALPSYGVCSLDALAAAVPRGREVLVVTDARRRQLYWARYDRAGVRVGGPEIDEPARIAADHAGDVLVVGPAAGLLAEPFADVSASGIEAPALASVVATAVASRPPDAVLDPLYLRRPDARPPGPPKAVTAR